MDWQSFIRGDMGWGASAAMVVAFLRLLLKGELILKREWDDLVKRFEASQSETKAAIDSGSKSSAETIQAQAELIKHLRKEQSE